MRDDNSSNQDCGGAGFLGKHRNHVGRFNVVVRETDDGTSIRVTTSWQADRYVDGSFNDTVQCVSTGVLERVLMEEIQERLGA